MNAGHMKTMAAHDTATITAGTYYYVIAKDPTIVSVKASGPYDVTYARQEDDPRYRQWFPF